MSFHKRYCKHQSCTQQQKEALQHCKHVLWKVRKQRMLLHHSTLALLMNLHQYNSLQCTFYYRIKLKLKDFLQYTATVFVHHWIPEITHSFSLVLRFSTRPHWKWSLWCYNQNQRSTNKFMKCYCLHVCCQKTIKSIIGIFTCSFKMSCPIHHAAC